MLDRLPPGWWAGFLSYELGGAVEARGAPTLDGSDGATDAPRPRPRPFSARLVLDSASGRSECTGRGEARDLLALAVEWCAPVSVRRLTGAPSWNSSLDRTEFEQRVATILEHIGAGDCYQVNLTRRLTCEQAVDPVGLFSALDRCNPSPHGAPPVRQRARHADGGRRVGVAGRFLSWRGRDAETRPIKGTGTDPRALTSSAKDRAENVMIVDLARNDFGRVCEPGSVVVPALCELETHPGLHHLVSTVHGRRRAGTGIGAGARRSTGIGDGRPGA